MIVNHMTPARSSTPGVKKHSPRRKGAKPAVPKPVDRLLALGDLPPLQRRRLDAAVMMLVNYLVSASSSE